VRDERAQQREPPACLPSSEQRIMAEFTTHTLTKTICNDGN